MTQSLPRWSSEDDRPPPESPFFRKLLEDLWEGLFTLIISSLVLVAMSIFLAFVNLLGTLLAAILATLTLAPVLTGMMASTGNAARGGFARLSYAWRGMLRLYWRSVALTLPLALFLAITFITANVMQTFPQRGEMAIALAVQFGICLTALVLHIYLLPVLALYDTSLKRTAMIAVVLAGKFIWQTVVLLVVAITLLAATLLHPLVWLFVPGIWCVIVMNATWRMARQIVPDAAGIDK